MHFNSNCTPPSHTVAKRSLCRQNENSSSICTGTSIPNLTWLKTDGVTTFTRRVHEHCRARLSQALRPESGNYNQALTGMVHRACRAGRVTVQVPWAIESHNKESLSLSQLKCCRTVAPNHGWFCWSSDICNVWTHHLRLSHLGKRSKANADV